MNHEGSAWFCCWGVECRRLRCMGQRCCGSVESRWMEDRTIHTMHDAFLKRVLRAMVVGA